MPDTFNFKESIALLRTNSKTFTRWLIKEGIDANQQINLADPRNKYITKEQLRLLAQRHGRTLPAWIDDATNAEPTAVTIETLAEHLVTLRTEVMQRLAQIEAMVQGIAAKPDGLATIADSAQTVQQHIVQRLDQLEQSLLKAIATWQDSSARQAEQKEDPDVTQRTEQPQAPAPPLALPATTTRSVAPAPKKTRSITPKKPASKKKPVKGKRLPKHLVLLRDFAAQHAIPMNRATAAGESGKISVIEGRWLVNSRWATEALDASGQQDFYTVFRGREGFTACPQCPHSLEPSAPDDTRAVTTAAGD